MEKSTHKCEIVRIGCIGVHPNADKLERVIIFGYEVCVGKGDFKGGELAVYIPPDSIVPAIDQFKFIWEGKGYMPPPGGDDTGHPIIPERYRRIKAKMLRGVVSEGLLMPLKAFPQLVPVEDGQNYLIAPGFHPVKEGDDVAELLGITHYDPPDPSTLGGDSERAPTPPVHKKKRGYPKTLRGWLRFLLSKLAFWRKSRLAEKEEANFVIPNYDVDAWQRYHHLLVPGEQVWINEKIHGSNCKFVWIEDPTDKCLGGRMWVGSHYQWKKDVPGQVFWTALRQNQWIEEFCRMYPGLVLYGELVPTQKLKYGQDPGKYRVFGFDVLDPSKKGPGLPQGKWLSYEELRNLGFSHTYLEGERFVERDLLDEVHWVPTIAFVSYDAQTVRKYASGKSLVGHADHIREGCVIRPMVERQDPRFGRVVLKIVSPEYLNNKISDENTYE